MVGQETMDLIHKLPEDLGDRFAANEEYSRGNLGEEDPSPSADEEDSEYVESVSGDEGGEDGEPDVVETDSEEDEGFPSAPQDVAEDQGLIDIIVAERTILQPKVVTVVPVQQLTGTWLLEPVPKYAGTQAVPAVYRELKSVAAVNLTEKAIVWKAGLMIATVAPMDPVGIKRDSNLERVRALTTIRWAR